MHLCWCNLNPKPNLTSFASLLAKCDHHRKQILEWDCVTFTFFIPLLNMWQHHKASERVNSLEDHLSGYNRRLLDDDPSCFEQTLECACAPHQPWSSEDFLIIKTK